MMLCSNIMLIRRPPKTLPSNTIFERVLGMLKKDITYEDLDGNKITETFYFHLNKAEAVQVQSRFYGAAAQKIESSINKNDFTVAIDAVLELILMAYGERSADNKAFIKNEENRNWFKNTNAYGELVEELSQSEEKLIAFIEGIMPAGFINEIKVNHQDKPTAPPASRVPPPLPPTLS